MFPATRTVPVDLNLVPFVNDVINALPGPLHRIAIRHRELIKFAIVGGTTFIVDMAIFYPLAYTILEGKPTVAKIISGVVSGKVKGGLTVMVNGIRAFLPGSLLDTRPVKDMTPFEGKTMDFKVIKLDRKRNNVVVSRRAVVEANQGEERQKLLETLQEGAVVKGIVKNITDYGAFVDLGGIDGLLHITDMAWRRVRHPSEVVTAGQEITAKILKFDTEKNRVSLGLKQMGDDPWMGVSRRYPQGTRMFGKVTNIADYGGDPQRIALLGHSAGADIVSNVLLNPAYLDAVGMTAADLACAGPLDSEGFDKFAAGTADIRGLQQEWRTALGNAPDYLRSTSANWLIAAGRDVPPIIGVVRGSTRRRAIETAFLTKLDAIGVPTTSIDASTLTHHEVNSRIGARGDRVMTPPLMRFLDRCLGVQVLDD